MQFNQSVTENKILGESPLWPPYGLGHASLESKQDKPERTFRNLQMVRSVGKPELEKAP